MSSAPSTTHSPTSLFYPGTVGDHPAPWQRVYMCTCGVELGFDEEGLGTCDPEGAFEDHLDDEGIQA